MKTVKEIEWILSELIAKELHLSRGQIDPEISFQQLGLDSQSLVSISGDLESMFSMSLDPVILFEYPTIRSMSAYLYEHQTAPRRKLKFSLFFFPYVSNNNSSYDLIREAAEYADKNGFEAIWIPERHFHPMGGNIPNPSVLGAYLASVTKKIKLRAGSVVLPLHHPVRVVEEWSMVDVLSKGRVELSFATGWHVNDFIFYPDRYAQRKDYLFDHLKKIKKLWSKGIELGINGDGAEVAVNLHPRPSQKNLSTWVTAIGNPETYMRIAKENCHLLTCLLDQNLEELTDKIKMYREHLPSRTSATNKVSVFLHTYVGTSQEEAKSLVKIPFLSYLEGTLDLLRQFNGNSQMKIDLEKMDPSQKNELLEFAFERYFHERSLMGDLDHCEVFAKKILQRGADELACIVDFGLPRDEVMAGLERLNELKNRFA